MVIVSLASTLFAASARDLKTKEVERIIWLPVCFLYVIHLVCDPGNLNIFFLINVLFYGIIQECFFARLYGKADCHAFFVCGIMLIMLKHDLTICFLHMTISFLILIAVQFLRGNIDRTFKLKRPVAFIPYISLSFVIVYLFCCV
ncbi:MAG: prepilin peptidase [Acetatifactor sp.]|nr:prepilin peptidase [Acetatifactor sp.]